MLRLTKNEIRACQVTIALALFAVASVLVVASAANEAPFMLCPSNVPIMSTFMTDLHCS